MLRGGGRGRGLVQLTIGERGQGLSLVQEVREGLWESQGCRHKAGDRRVAIGGHDGGLDVIGSCKDRTCEDRRFDLGTAESRMSDVCVKRCQ